MIDYIEDHRLKKYKERIGQEKPKLVKKVQIMLIQILQEFNEGQPPANLVIEIQSTLQLLISFSLPLSDHRLGQLKAFNKKVIESLSNEARAKVSESVNTRYTLIEEIFNKDIKSDQQEMMKRFEPMIDKQDRYLSVIALLMILGTGIYYRGDFRPVRTVPAHRRFILRLIRKTCCMFLGKQANFTLTANFVLLAVEAFIKSK